MQGSGRSGVLGEATFPPRRLPMKRCVFAVFAVFALAAPAGALASGVVLKTQPDRHLIAVARTPSTVQLVHTKAAGRLHVGQRVDLHARRLPDGTLAASKAEVHGRAQSVRFRAQVVSVGPDRLVVSAGGAVIVLNGHAPVALGPGSEVEVIAAVRDDDLDEQQITVFTPASPGGTIE